MTDDRVLFRFLWWPHALRFGRPKKWLVFKGIVQTHHEGSCVPTGGYDLFGDKGYTWNASYWGSDRWYSGAVNEPKLTPKIVIKGLLWSAFTFSSALLVSFLLGRILWVMAPDFWDMTVYFSTGLFDFFFGWML